jgi:hypothetical protein
MEDILRNAVSDERHQSVDDLGSEIAALFAGNGLDADIPKCAATRLS